MYDIMIISYEVHPSGTVGAVEESRGETFRAQGASHLFASCRGLTRTKFMPIVFRRTDNLFR